jgi:MoxR-like ATPase
MRCARVEAAARGSEFVTPDDVKRVARPVMAHRLVLSPDASLEGIGPDAVVESVLGQVQVPRE